MATVRRCRSSRSGGAGDRTGECTRLQPFCRPGRHSRRLGAALGSGKRDASEPVGEFENQWRGIFFLIVTNAEQAQKRFNEPARWAAAPLPPWGLTRYTIDLATLAQPAMLGLGRF